MGKGNNPEFPYTVGNEIVASHIGNALGLNVPPVFVHKISEEYLALSPLSARGDQSATAIAAYVADHTREVHGAILFDVFLANNDRAFGPERRNLLIDDEGELLLYDNANSCFYRPRASAGIDAGIPRLDAVEASLEAMMDMAHKGNEYFRLLNEKALVEEWSERIAALSTGVIDAAIGSIPAGLSVPSEEERDRLRRFLMQRKDQLVDIVVKNPQYFPTL